MLILYVMNFNWKKLLFEVAKLVLYMLLGEAIEPAKVTVGPEVTAADFGATAGIISAALAAAGSAGSAVATSKLNKKTRQWNEKMWNLQNEYNLPSAQMQRFKDAGLNPHLIYGQGNSGNAGSAPSWSPSAPDYSELGSVVGKGIQAALAKGQLDKLRTENAILNTALESNQIDLDVKKRAREISEITDTGDVIARDLYVDAARGDAYKRISAGKISEIEKYVREETANADISYSTAKAVNEAARSGLIDAQTAESLSRQKLQDLDAMMKKYETDFIQNIGLKTGDAGKVLQMLVMYLLKSK